MGKYIDHRLVARSEPDNTFWTASTINNNSKKSFTISHLKYRNYKLQPNVPVISNPRVLEKVLSVQKVLSGSGSATRRWSMYFIIRRSLLRDQNRTIPFGTIVHPPN